MDNSIYLETQGVKGGKTKTQKVGYIYANPTEDSSISIDAFTGQGETYKPREYKLIVITHGIDVVFTGTFGELILKLK